jgi:hypothetical protein
MKKEKSTKPGYGKILDAWVPPENAGEPVGCVATSFTFSPAMFEEECLGRFLALETNAAEDGPAYLVEREEKLSQLSCAAALVDQNYARGMRSLRWDFLPARPPHGILHAKVSLLLWSSHARLIIASANLTDDGYRRNQEVFGVLDYYAGSDSPLPLFDEIADFLRGAVDYARPATGVNSPAVTRWLNFIERAYGATRTWGATEPPRSLSKPRVVAVCTGPGRPSIFNAIRKLWPDNSPPDRAFVISPFFDPPDAPNEPARQIWNLLKQRGSASVEYNVTAEEVPGENAMLVHAPESLIAAQPANRSQLETTVQRLRLEESRPLHAKCLWLESDRLILSVIGSSNFTSAGLGLGTVQNLEANLGFIVGQQTSDAKKAILNAWLPIEEIPDGIEIRWQARDDDGEDSAPADLLVLPTAFADATFGGAIAHESHITFTFAGHSPVGWALFAEEDDKPFLTDADWQERDCPATLQLAWPGIRPPSGGFAWWPVNARDSTSLPPPDELKNIPLEVLIDILTSAKPLHIALALWLKQTRDDTHPAADIQLDPHKRVDTSAFLLQRTRRVSWALTALRHRLEKPLFSDQSLAWRLRGPVGVLALAQAVSKEAHSEPERCFLLTELCLDLARVRPQVAPGSLSKSRVTKALQELIREIRTEISPEALAAEPAMAAYTKSAFEEVVG